MEQREKLLLCFQEVLGLPARTGENPVSGATSAESDSAAAWALQTALLRARAIYELHLTEPEPEDGAERKASERRADVLRIDYNQAMERYMLHPVSDAGQLALKLEHFIEGECYDTARAGEYLAVLAADARRVQDAVA